MKDKSVLHLVLERKWWDMIAEGEKKEEYREINKSEEKLVWLLMSQIFYFQETRGPL